MQRIKDVVDIALKLACTAALIVFLYQYAQGVWAGRYQYVASGELEYIMDTATGVLYQGGNSMNHITGKESLAGKPKK
jgi:hypothetical protein